MKRLIDWIRGVTPETWKWVVGVILRVIGIIIRSPWLVIPLSLGGLGVYLLLGGGPQVTPPSEPSVRVPAQRLDDTLPDRWEVWLDAQPRFVTFSVIWQTNEAVAEPVPRAALEWTVECTEYSVTSTAPYVMLSPSDSGCVVRLRYGDADYGPYTVP